MINRVYGLGKGCVQLPGRGGIAKIREVTMKIKQISVLLENKPGHLSSVCKTLGDAGINILTLSLADTRQFGILRLIVEDWEGAKKILEDAGCVVNITEVIATEIEDRPGGLAKILQAIEGSDTNIEYMYAFTFGKKERAVMVFRFDDPDAAVDVLRENGIAVLGGVSLLDLAK